MRDTSNDVFLVYCPFRRLSPELRSSLSKLKYCLIIVLKQHEKKYIYKSILLQSWELEATQRERLTRVMFLVIMNEANELHGRLLFLSV